MVVIHDVANGVGESPVWDNGVLRWVDIPARTVHAMTPDGAVSGTDVGELACWHGTPPDGGCDGPTLDEHGYPCCFGGQDLRTLYVTSARFGLSEAALSANPQEGAVLAVDVGVAGRPANRFAG